MKVKGGKEAAQATEPIAAGQRVTRYRLWTVDPLNTDDEQPVFGTFSLASAKRIVELYNRRPDCDRVAVIRPVAVEVPVDHAYFAALQFESGQHEEVHVVANDAYAAARGILHSRHQDGIAAVGLWLFQQDRDGGSLPLIQVNCDAVPIPCPKPAPARPAAE